MPHPGTGKECFDDRAGERPEGESSTQARLGEQRDPENRSWSQGWPTQCDLALSEPLFGSAEAAGHGQARSQ
jgi:hypothetical protein